MILIDPRAGSEELLSPLKSMGYPALSQTLEFGDVAFYGNGPAETEISIGIEYKKMDDLLMSMQDERLMGHQVPGMLAAYSRNYLVIEGTPMLQSDGGFKSYEPRGHRWRRPHNTHLTLRRLLSFLVSVEECGVSYVMLPTQGSVCSWIGALYSWWQMDYVKHEKVHIHQRPLQLILPTLKQKIAFLLPEIGQGKMKDVNSSFLTARTMVNASSAKWKEIKGVGDKIADGIQEALDES